MGMRKLTNTDLTNIAGSMVEGYEVEAVRVKRGEFSDSDHYGIILGRNTNGNYVRWQFHLLEDDSLSAYWGRYFMENREDALRDYDIRDRDASAFKVTITETLKLTVEVEAKDRHEAEQMISDNWRNSEYVLDADNFAGVKFKAVIAVDDDK